MSDLSMTFDEKGRIIASDQYGSLYRLKVPAIGDTTSKTSIEELKIYADTINTKSPVTIGYAHGLLWAFNSLYVMINNRSNDKLKHKSTSKCTVIKEKWQLWELILKLC
jgi:hypothetical protein